MALHYTALQPGDPAPWFEQASTSNPRYVFDSAAGRYIVLCFYGSAGDEAGAARLRRVQAQRELFDDRQACFFGVSLDPVDQASGRVAERLPGIRHFWDFDGRIARLYGALPQEAEGVAGTPVRRFWLIIDPTLRVLRRFAFAADGSDGDAVMAFVAALPAPALFAGRPLQAPVLYLPNVFEPDFCSRLIGLYESHGGTPSGFMRERDGLTVGVLDPGFKQRRDHVIADEEAVLGAQARIRRRVVPEIAKVHQFEVTRMERHIVACYDASEGGHFRPHRDNTTQGTAHRRFAVSINLNADFDGGEVSFPEYGPDGFKPPPGAALVFSCSLLHAVSPVKRGRRYAFLPFLYDEAAARLRVANNPYLDPSVGDYRGTFAE